MSKGQNTRGRIIEEAARLFNTRGYASGSLSELMERTGLKKGGIYNHFSSKEEIAAEAFEYAIGEINKKLFELIKDVKTAEGKLLALIDYYEGYALDPLIEGGCPVMNTSLEADDTNPMLREKARTAISRWVHNLQNIVNFGVEKGEFNSNADGEAFGVLFITMIEGGISITRACNDDRYIKAVGAQLRRAVAELA